MSNAPELTPGHGAYAVITSLIRPIAKITMTSQAEYRAPIFFVHYRN